MLNEDVPLPKPEKMTLGQITSELELRGLSTTGSRSELNRRLTQDDLSNFFHYTCPLSVLFFLQRINIDKLVLPKRSNTRVPILLRFIFYLKCSLHLMLIFLRFLEEKAIQD